MPLNLASSPAVLSVGFCCLPQMHTDGQASAVSDGMRCSQPTVQDHLLPGLDFNTSMLLLLSRFSHVQLCATHRQQPTRLPHPWDSPGKNTEVGCQFLLQCRKVKKNESEVAQSCPTLSDPMDCSLAGSSPHGIFQARVLEWGAIAFSITRLQWTFNPLINDEKEGIRVLYSDINSFKQPNETGRHTRMPSKIDQPYH